MNILSNPFFVFSLVWMLPLMIITTIPVAGYGLSWSSSAAGFIIFNIILFGVSFLFVKFAAIKKRPSVNQNYFASPSFVRAAGVYLNRLLYIWLLTYIFIVFIDGGLPLFWVLLGDPRTYVDFGIPTISGLTNMVRAFLVVGFYVLFKFDTQHRKRYFLILTGLLGSAFVLETSRGNGTFLLLHLICIYLVFNRPTLRLVVNTALICVVLLFFGGLLNAFRYGQDLDYLLTLADNYGMENFSGGLFSAAFVPAISYLTLPLVNLNLKLDTLPLVSFSPYYSLQGVFPTVIRELMFQKGDYGLIVDEAHNVASFFDPIIRDFGSLFSLPILFFLYSVVSYVYVRAINGSIFYLLAYPPLFASTALSFFSMYYLLLVVLLYPFLVWHFFRFVGRRVNLENQSKCAA
jgi:hypothetical protein